MSPQDAEPGAPAWFERAIAQQPRRSLLPVAGGEVELLAWGGGAGRGILFLHGNAAHADWWSFIAPAFAADRPVAAISWSGMGGSSWRSTYGYDTYAQEALAAIEAAGLDQGGRPPIVVAHSFGGFPAMHLACRHPARIEALILVDVFVRPPDVELPRWTQRAMKPAHFETREAGMARFRYRPVQAAPLPYINAWIAARSLRPDGEGWTWKIDPDLPLKLRREDPRRLLAEVSRPVRLIAGGASAHLTDDMLAYMRGLRPDMAVSVIPGAGHHIMVDHPLELIDTLAAEVSELEASGI